MCVRDDGSNRAYSYEAALYLSKEHVGCSVSTPKIMCCRKSHAQTCPFFIWENTRSRPHIGCYCVSYCPLC